MSGPVIIEIFSTDVTDQITAGHLVARIQQTFTGYRANFDLHDRERILRIECSNGNILPASVISILKENGYNACLIPDIPVLQENNYSG